jgi:hypothetical protein
LWRSGWKGRTAVIPTPIYEAGHVFVTSGYGVGNKLIEIGDNKPKDIYANKDLENHHGGVIKIGDYLYGHSNRGGWTCKEFKTGKTMWQERGIGKGSIAYADGMLYCYSEKSGTLALVKASPKGWDAVSEISIPSKSEVDRKKGAIWTHPVVANGRLYLRDNDLIFCYDIKAK